MAINNTFDFKNIGEVTSPRETIHAGDLYGIIGDSRGFGVISGCAVTRTINTITVGSGDLFIGGSVVSFVADDVIVDDVGMSSGQYRWTAIYVTPAGAIGSTNGTPGTVGQQVTKPTDTTNLVIAYALKTHGSDLTDVDVVPAAVDLSSNRYIGGNLTVGGSITSSSLAVNGILSNNGNTVIDASGNLRIIDAIKQSNGTSVIYLAGGNVGIGTSSPLGAGGSLQLESTSGSYGFIHSLSQMHISENAYYDGTAWKSMGDPTDIAVVWQTQASASKIMRLAVDTTAGATGTSLSLNELFTILTSGNVGIGTGSPGEKLEVSGGGIASNHFRTNSINQVVVYRVWSNDSYGMGMTNNNNVTDGIAGITDYAVSFAMNQDSTRGFVFGSWNSSTGVSTFEPSFAINANNGNVEAKGNYYAPNSNETTTFTGYRFSGSVNAGVFFNTYLSRDEVWIRADGGSTRFVVGDSQFQLEGHPTSGNSANLYISSTGGHMYRSTASSRRYKENIQDVSLDPNVIYSLRLRSYDYIDGYVDHGSRTGYYGLIAEEAFDLEPSLVILDEENLPEDIHTKNLMYRMLGAIQDLNNRWNEYIETCTC